MSKAFSHLLDGTTMQYTYDEMGTVRSSYQDGRISFEWVSGPLKGETGEGFLYRAKELGRSRACLAAH